MQPSDSQYADQAERYIRMLDNYAADFGCGLSIDQEPEIRPDEHGRWVQIWMYVATEDLGAPPE